MPHIKYRTKLSTSLRLDFLPDSEFRAVVDTMGEIGYPKLAINADLVSFALLELVANSLRAHKERKIDEPVRIDFRIEDNALAVTVVDSGRGFNPTRLPYDLDAPVAGVDLMSSEFSEYREKNGGSRFGIGLYVAKKTFPRFNLRFIDREDQTCPWYSGAVKGTCIDVAVPLAAMVTEPGKEAETVTSHGDKPPKSHLDSFSPIEDYESLEIIEEVR